MRPGDVRATGRPPPPEPRSETRSPVLRRILLSATGLAWTVLVALGIELLGSPWSGLSPLRAAGWVLLVVVLLVLAGWWISTVAERARLAHVRKLSRPIPGPPAPLRANWSPGPEPELTEETQAAADAVVASLRESSAVTVSGGDPVEVTTVVRAAAHRVMELSAFQAAYRDLRGHVTTGTSGDSSAYAAASIVFPAFGMVVPDCSDAALERAARRLVQELRADPALVVLDHVHQADAVEWLLRAWPSDGSAPWLVVVHEVQPWPETTVPAVVLDGAAPSKPGPAPPAHRAIEEFHADARVLARTLAELPPCELGADAVAAVHAEVSPGATRPLLEMLGDLGRHGVVECSPDTARYRMHPQQRAWATEIEWPHDTPPRWPAALPALLQHYADLCDQWLTALRTVANAGKARQWFRTEEPVLHALVTGTRPAEPRLAIDQLTRIADALDVWYARQYQPVRSLRVSNALYHIADDAGYPIHRALAQTRQRAAYRRGAPGYPPEPAPLPRHRLRAAMHARQAHEQGLEHLNLALSAAPTDHGLLDRAEASLKEAWLALPRADIAGAIAVALDLAVVHLHQGRLDSAQDRLDVAEDLTFKDSDLPGQAHVHELMGIVAWSGGERYRAVDRWLNAFGLFCKLADERGESRCLQHLATAVLADPGLARLALPASDDPETDPFDETYALLNARSWLERSLKLRPAQDDACLAARYLGEVDRRLPPRSEPGRIRSPRIPDDDHQPSRLERFGARLDRLVRRPGATG